MPEQSLPPATEGARLETPDDFARIRVSWAPYVQAKLGFRNYWYPAAFARDLDGDRPLGVRLLGENVLLRRVDGTVLAVHDQCLHHGVRFSRKPECYTPETITCWYHGWTFDFRDGKLVDILTEPGSKLRGKLALQTYPVIEAKGIVFVFVGDGDPPPLADDVPPGFLDDDVAIEGIRDSVATNWRVGAENGFDTTHIYIHRESVLLEANQIALPLGLVPKDKEGIEILADREPKGILDKMAENYVPIFEGHIRGEKVLDTLGAKGTKRIAGELSIWMPGVLKVDPFPDPTIVQFEWYVPVDVDVHMYWRVLARTVESADQAAAFRDEFESRWRPVALHGFNDLDVWAREGLQEFYKDDDAWSKEHLFKPDLCVVEWRKLASRHHRGLQPVKERR